MINSNKTLTNSVRELIKAKRIENNKNLEDSLHPNFRKKKLHLP